MRAAERTVPTEIIEMALLFPNRSYLRIISARYSPVFQIEDRLDELTHLAEEQAKCVNEPLSALMKHPLVAKTFGPSLKHEVKVLLAESKKHRPWMDLISKSWNYDRKIRGLVRDLLSNLDSYPNLRLTRRISYMKKEYERLAQAEAMLLRTV